MADLKISALTAASSVDPLDLLPTVDVSDTTMNASGTTKKTTRELLQTYNAGTLTTDKKILDLSATWNNAAVTFTGLKLNVTDTASASGSLLLDVQKGGTSQLVLNKNGDLSLGSTQPFFPLPNRRNLTLNGSSGSIIVLGFNNDSSTYLTVAANSTTLSETRAAPLILSSTDIERLRLSTSVAVFNELGNDYDFRVEGDTDANLFFVDASTDRVGIGTNAPSYKLDVRGDIYSLRNYVDTSNGNFIASGNIPGISLNSTVNGRFSVFTAYSAANTTSFVVGTGTSNPSVESVRIDHSTGGFTVNNAAVFNESGGDYDFRVEGDTDANLLFVDASTDRVGIGTNAPGAKLQVIGSGADAAGAYIGAGSSNLFDAQNNVFRLSNQTEVMRLNSSGNLGLGVTPSAWNSVYRAIQVGTVGIMGRASGQDGYLYGNVYWDGTNERYVSTGVGNQYRFSTGGHTFFTAPSGTAGNVATFTERATIGLSSFVVNDPGADYDFRVEGDTDANLLFVDASTDRVGIGTNAPGEKLHLVKGNSGIRLDGAGTPASNVWIDYYVPNNGGSQTTSNFAGRIYATSSGTADFSDNSLRIAVPIGAGNTPVDTLIVKAGNLGLRTAVYGTSASGVLAIGSGTAPTTGPADTVQIYSSDLSAGNTMLSIYTEGTSVSDSTDNAVTKKIAVRINGTVYYLLADTDNS